MFYNPDTPILQQVRPSETAIEVLKVDDPALPVVDAPGKLLETLTRYRDFVAVIKVRNITSTLTSEGTWVDSKVTAQIVDVWKAAGDSIQGYAQGESIVFSSSSGATVQVGDITVIARSSWAKPLEEGHEYLVFGWHYKGELRVPPDDTYEVTDSRLTLQRLNRGRDRDDIERQTVIDAKARVKAAAMAK